MPISRTILRVVLLCGAAAAAEADDTGFTTTQIATGVYLLQGYENNIVASVGDDGIVVVDTHAAEVADKLITALKRLSDKPIRFAIDTHAHGDHSGGNAAFKKLAPVIAHDNVRKWLMSGNDVTGDKKQPPEALPIVTFSGEMTLHLNGEDIRLLSLPPGHTDSDVAVVFENAKVVATGDVFMSPGVSFGDRWYGGGMVGLIHSLEILLPQIPDDAKVVPGHGVISSRADVVNALEILKQMKAMVEGAIRKGKTQDQLVAERPFDKWRSSFPVWASSDKSIDGWVKGFYRELAPQPAGK